MILGGIYSASWAGERWESCLLSILFFIIGIVIVFFAYAFFENFMSQGLPIISIGITTVLGGIIGLSSSLFYI